MSTTAAPLPVRLECAVNLTPQTLEIDLTLHNHGSVDVGVFNRIAATQPDGTLLFSPDLCYVEIEHDVLLVRKMALPIPEGLSMTAYVPPYASRLPAGQKLSERVRLPLPVKVMQPFKRALLKGQVVADRPVSARSLMVEVGIFPIDGSVQLVAENPAFPDVFTALPPGPAVTRQHVLSKSFSPRQTIPVLDYRAVPWP